MCLKSYVFRVKKNLDSNTKVTYLREIWREYEKLDDEDFKNICK